MTRQNPRSQKPRSGRTLGCGLALGGVFLIALCVTAFILLRAQRSKDVITAWISLPVTDQQVEVNQPLSVLAGAAYPSGMSRVEVYADGALVLAKDNTGQGETTLSVTGLWTPLTSGSHVLLARGYARDDSYADSEVIYVDVTEPPESVTVDVDSLPGEENPSLDVLAQYLGTTPEELARLNPGLDPSAPLPSGTRVEAPHPPSSPHPPSPPPPGNPAAPTGLSGSADCSNAFLTWTASPDAQSYRVYRLGPNPRDSHLSLQTEGLRATTYTDTLPAAPGDYRYLIASVRNGREGRSLMFTVSTPMVCPGPPAPPPPDLVLTAAMVDTDAAWDGIYCYISVNDQTPNHVPERDSSYLPPEASNPRYYNLTRQPSGGRWSLAGQPLTIPVTFFSQCWGRRGPNSTILGSFLVSHPQADWDGRLLTASGGAYRFTYCLGPGSTPCTPTVPGIATTIRDLSGSIVSLYLPPPTNLRRVASTDWFCIGGCPPTVSWDWTETPSVPESSLTGYTVVRTTYDQYTGMRLMPDNTWEVNRSGGSLPKRFLAQENDLQCGQRVMYRVRARQAANQSELSDPISFYTPLCTTGANVRIIFDTLQVGTVDETGEEGSASDPRVYKTLEVRGFIYATADLPAGYSLIHQTSASGNYHTLREGTYPWNNLVNVNSFTTRIMNARQTLTIGAAIDEVDTDLSGAVIRSTTPWCVAELVLRAGSLEEWGRLNLPFILNGGNAEASCTITGRVVGTPVR